MPIIEAEKKRLQDFLAGGLWIVTCQRINRRGT
jgi:hypothetical protein